MARKKEKIQQLQTYRNKHLRLFSYFLFPFFILIFALVSGCAYSFRGGSVPAGLKTVAIPLVQDQSGYGDPALRDMLTQKLTDAFTSDNTLQITSQNTADSKLQTVITKVKDEPSAVSGGEFVTTRKITVTVHVTFEDLKQRKKLWEKDFTNWGEYPSGSGPTERNQGITDAVQKITEDILNETVAGW